MKETDFHVNWHSILELMNCFILLCFTFCVVRSKLNRSLILMYNLSLIMKIFYLNGKHNYKLNFLINVWKRFEIFLATCVKNFMFYISISEPMCTEIPWNDLPRMGTPRKLYVKFNQNSMNLQNYIKCMQHIFTNLNLWYSNYSEKNLSSL